MTPREEVWLAIMIGLVIVGVLLAIFPPDPALMLSPGLH